MIHNSFGYNVLLAYGSYMQFLIIAVCNYSMSILGIKLAFTALETWERGKLSVKYKFKCIHLHLGHKDPRQNNKHFSPHQLSKYYSIIQRTSRSTRLEFRDSPGSSTRHE